MTNHYITLMLNFKHWLEYTDNFGEKKPFYNKKGPDDLPIERLNVQRLVEYLLKYNLGVKKPRSKFFNECQWGEAVGALKITITPNLNLKIQKLHNDFEGNPVWIMKKFFFIDDYNYAGKEDVVALEVLDQLRNVNDEQLESPSYNIKLEELVRALSSRLNTLESYASMPDSHSIKKNSNNEYTLFYNIRGGGVGSSRGVSTINRILEVLVNLSWHKNTGLIKASVSVVGDLASGDKGGGSWQIIPSDFVEYFMPTQDKKEIVESIITVLKSY